MSARPGGRRRAPAARAAASALAASLVLAAAGCASHATGPAPTRPFRMGFSAVPPSADPALAIRALEMWTARADAGLVFNGPPWMDLLAGAPADSLVRAQTLPIVQYYRAKGLRVVVCVDPENGLNRASDADSLVAHGRSLTEAPVQAAFRAYCVAVDTLVHPDAFAVAIETNLIRVAAPATLYAAVVQAANGAAADLRAHDAAVRVFVTVQVETAWGRLPPAAGYVGIAQDLADFPFTQTLGLSSYPCFAWADPDSVPGDYFTRLVQGTGLRPLMTEGGWTSVSLASVNVSSSPTTQARWIRREGQLLDAARAEAWFQITFTDLDLTGVALPPGSILPLFAHMGLVDASLAAKPALAEWDAFEKRKLSP